MPFTEVDAAHYLGQVLRRQLWQEQSLFYSGKSSLSFTQVNPANPQYKPPWQYIYKWRFVSTNPHDSTFTSDVLFSSFSVLLNIVETM